jgi:stage IV sporulation protein FB
MSWSFTIGRVFGTEVRIHLTFFLLVAWFAVSAGMRDGQAGAIQAAAFVLAVFACVLAHEFGHVLVARRFGIATSDVTLLPIGGVANMARMPEDPGQELWIALAGPAVNVVIALLLVAVAGARLDPTQVTTAVTGSAADFATRLAAVNIVLVVFNLLPAFPMDGGRVLRALLSWWMGRPQATRIAARIGQSLAFVLGFLGLFGNPLLIFIALFVFMAASQEAYAVELGDATSRGCVGRATITSFSTLQTDARVGDAVDLLLSTSQREFPVTDGAGRLRGVLTRDGMIQALATSGPDTAVLGVMERDIATVHQRVPLSQALAALETSGRSLVGVIDDDQRVVGLVTMENLAEYMMVERARRGRPEA